MNAVGQTMGLHQGMGQEMARGWILIRIQEDTSTPMKTVPVPDSVEDFGFNPSYSRLLCLAQSDQ